MARIPYPDPAKLPEANRKLLEALPPLNVFRMIAGSGPSFAPFIALINAYLNEGILDPELRELVILRVGHLCHSPYEQHQHRRVARSLRMTEERISATEQTIPSPHFDEAENAALLLADELVRDVRPSAGAFDAAHKHLGDAGIQELLIIVGVYLMVCRYLETLEIEIEEKGIKESGLAQIRESMKP